MTQAIPKEVKLDKLVIADNALNLLNQFGFEGLTTRKLAEELNVQSPALYWHFKSKQELLAQMRELMIQKCLDRLPVESDWEKRLWSIAHEMRAILLSYRDSTQVLTAAPLSEKSKQELIPQLYQPLLEFGWTKKTAAEAILTITSYTIGWVGYEQSQTVSKLMLDTVNIEESFSHGVEVFIKGFKQEQR